MQITLLVSLTIVVCYLLPLNQPQNLFVNGREGRGLHLCFIGIYQDVLGRGGGGVVNPRGYPSPLSPICDDIKENEKP